MRRDFLIGAVAALTAFAMAQGLWALSTPHGRWTSLIFALFPGPAMDECARLIAVFAISARARVGAFAAGFALCAAFASAGVQWFVVGDPLALAIALAAALSLQVLLSLAAFAMAARNAAPFFIFCVLALIHGGHNGGLIALEGVVNRIEFFAAELVLAALYAAGAFALVRGGQIPAAAKIG